MKPSRRLLTYLLGLCLLACVLGTGQALAMPWAALLSRVFSAALLLLIVTAVIDAIRVWRLPSPQLERLLPSHLPLGRSSEIRLKVQHSYTQLRQIQLLDHPPSSMQFDATPIALELRPNTFSDVGYKVCPLQRGHWQFPVCEITLNSDLGLWQSRRYIALSSETRVYPDFAKLHGANLMTMDQWISQLGIRQTPRRGLGLEFHQLREFREGDSLRQIDWKATARKRTPIAREYQDERDQQIIFMLDCGRRMRSQDDQLAHFDHALNACLLLSYIALRQGDAVGLCTFASEQPRFVAAHKGHGQFNHLLNALYDVQSTQQAADYASAVNDLLSKQRRRALIIILTNLRDEDDQELISSVKRLAKQHRVLIASLREDVLDRVRTTPVTDYASAISYCGTLNYLASRNRLYERLQAQQVPIVDARPSEIGPELVSQYLRWKKAGVI